MRNVISIIAIAFSVLTVSAQSIQKIEFTTPNVIVGQIVTPDGVTSYVNIGHDNLREKAITTNAQYVRIVLSLLSVLSSKNEMDENLYSEYVNFYSNPSTDSYLFPTASKMIAICYSNPGALVDYIANDIYSRSNLGTTEIAANHPAAPQLSELESIKAKIRNMEPADQLDARAQEILATVHKYCKPAKTTSEMSDLSLDQ